MATEKKSFFACNAFLSRITGKYTCDVWLWNDWKNPNYDPALALPVDLSATPSKDWANASIDDYSAPEETNVTRGLTTLGPHWPGSTRVAGREHGAEAGIYLETTLLRRAQNEEVTLSNGEKKTRMPVWPPGDPQQPAASRQQYRYECVVYRDDDGSIRRYFGFHASVLTSPDNNNNATFRVYLAQDTTPHLVEVSVTDLEQCDTIEWNRWTNLSNPGSEGPLYLRWKYASSTQIALSSPKLPFGLGAGGDLQEGRIRSDLREEPVSVITRVKQYLEGPYHLEKAWSETASFISVSHDNPDDELRVIQQVLSGRIEIVDDRWGVETFIRILSTNTHAQDQTLDLVSHSTAVSLFLDFDGWQVKIDPELVAFCSRIRGQMSRFKALRLIGCATAGSAEGRAALSALQEALGIPVLGTASIVYSGNFEAGHYDGSSLVPADRMTIASFMPPDKARISAPVTSRFHYSTRQLPEPRFPRVFCRLIPDEFIARYLDVDRVWYLPGLLTKPFAELIVSHNNDLLFGEVLFNWRLFRVKLDDDKHAVFPIVDPIALRDLIIGSPGNMRAFGDALRLA